MKLKKLLNLKKRNRREPRANDFTVESLEPRLLLSATPMTAAVVVTDHQDYAPGETAVITTSNQAGDGVQFSAGEMVSFQITRTDGMADYSGSTTGVGPTGNEAWYVTDGIGGFTAHLGSDVSGDGVADWIAPDNDLMANSSISTTWYVEEQYRNSSLLVTAAGQESGAMATHAFTDANVSTSTVVTASSATSTYGDDVTFTATVTPSAGGTTSPVGTVTFFDNGVEIGPTSSANPGAGLSSTFAITLSEATLSQLAAGSHSITAVFSGGDNGTDSFNTSTSGAINHTVGQKDVTATFVANTKVYDGTNAADASLFTSVVNGTVGIDFVFLDVTGATATFDDLNAGDNKNVTLIGATLGGTEAANYNLTAALIDTEVLPSIVKAEATITVNGFTGIFDGLPHGATGTATGVLGEPLAGLNLGAQFTAVPGGTAVWSFTDVTGNYNDNPGGTVDIVINEIVNTVTTIAASTPTSTYGQSVILTATVTAAAGSIGPLGTVEFFDGVGNSLGSTNISSPDGIDPLASIFTLNVTTLNAGIHSTIHAVFTGNTAFNSSTSANTTVNVSKADATINVLGYTGVYDAAAHGATGSATGVGGVDLSAGLNLGASFTDAPGGTANWTFSGGTNYNDASGSVAIVIAKADATIVVNGYTGVFDTLAHGATGAATGVGGVDLSAGLNLGASFTDVPGGTADWTFTGGTNYNDANGSVAIVITAVAVDTATTITASVPASIYGDSVTLTATVTAAAGSIGPLGTVEFFDGVGNSLGSTNISSPDGIDPLASIFTLNVTTLNAGIHSTIHAVFTGNTAFNSSTSANTTVNVSKADATINVLGYTGVYDAAAHGATGSATGVGGVDLSAGLNLGASFTDAPGGTANWTFSGGTNYNDASGSVAIVIAKADATIVVNGYTGVYDAAAHGATGTATGIGGEDLSAGLATDSFIDAPGGIANWTFSGGTNYNDASGNVSIIISAKEITGSFTASNKVYDGTTDATVLTASFLGVINSDDVTLDGGIATFDTKDVGINKTVTLTGATLGGLDAGNYVLSPAAITTTASITAKAITGNFTAADKIYDGTTLAGVAGTGLSGVLTGDLGNVSLTGGTATFGDKNVGVGKTVTLTGATLSGLAAGNYTLISVATDQADITALGITGDFTAANKFYDGNAVAGVVTRTLPGAILGDAVSLTGGTAAFADANAGTGKTVTLTGATLSGADATNYNLLSVNTTTANIVALGITGSFTADSKVYDGTTAATVSGTSFTGVLAGDVGNVSLTGGTATFADKNVGVGKTVTLLNATLSGLAASNYSLLSVATTTAEITALGITGSFTADSKVYDGNTLAGVSLTSLSGAIVGDDVVLTFDLADFDTKEVGLAKTVTLFNAGLGGLDAGNYSLLSTDITAQANITALQLDFTFTVDDKVYDGGTAATGLIGNLTGFNGADDVDWAFSTVAFNSAIAGPSKLVNLTGLILIGLDAGNYSLASSTVQSTAAITQKQLTVTFTVNDKAYDGNTSVTGLATTLDGVIAPDDVTLAFSSVAFNSAIVGPAKLVNMTGATLIGTEATNYSLASSTITSTAAITAKQLTASFTVNNKVYDGNTSTTGLVMTLNGVIAPDNVSLTGGVATFDDANAGNGKTVTLTGLGITGTEATNYSLASSTATTTADITKADATINVLGYSGVYDAAAHGATGSATGIGGVDLSAGLNLGASFTNALGGTANWTFSGGTNYNDASGSVAIVINKANAVLTLTGYYGTYDGSAHQASGTATGVLGESLAGLNMSVTSHTNAGVYIDTVTFTDVTGNYKDTIKNVKSTINKANATLVLTSYYGTYDGSAHQASGTATGVLGESLAGLNMSVTSHTNAGVYIDTVTFTDVTGNYKNTIKNVKSTINKANAVIVLTGYVGTYDGVAHQATGTATGVLGESLSGLDLSVTSHTNAGVYIDAVTFTDVTGNYKNTLKNVKSTIYQANAVIVLTGYDVLFDGSAHTATGTATGVLGEDLSAGLNLSSTTHTNVGTYLDTVTFTDATGNYKFTVKNVSNRIR